MEVLAFFFYLVVLYLFFLVVRYYLEKLRLPDLDTKAVFVTGCDSGFGKGIVLKCLENGMPVFAGCLTDKGADELRLASRWMKGKLVAFKLDVTNDESVVEARKLLEEKTKIYGGLHGVVNNAGIAGFSSLDDFLTVDDYKQCLEVNTFGVIRVTQQTKKLVKQARGRFVQTASMLARCPLYGIGPYAVSKHGVGAYSDVVRQELQPFGVGVSIIEPGFFKTHIVSKSNLSKLQETIWSRVPEDVKAEYGEGFFEEMTKAMHENIESGASSNIQLVVDVYFHALTAVFPRSRYVVGLDANILFIPSTYLPTDVFDFLYRTLRQLRGAPTPAVLKQ